jgi:hypothetical protein
VNEHERRIGLNEALYRDVNEKLRSINAAFASITETFEIMCECGHSTCTDRFSIAPSAYEELRADPLLFAVAPGHETGEVEQVVSVTDLYEIVRKRPGDPASIASATDPRS